MNEGQALWIALNASVVAIICGIIFSLGILKQPDGNERMREIAGAIQEGAKAYLNRQYLTIGIVGIVIFLLLGFSGCLLYTSPSPRDGLLSRMPSSA